jgi:proteasome lid subunit RPN8/RPN11
MTDSDKSNMMQWDDSGSYPNKEFPGPQEATALLKIAFRSSAYSNMHSHIRSDLSREVCGVLVGNIFQDKGEAFLEIAHIIEGKHVDKGSKHVTFTHDTWNDIHQKLDSQYKDMQIIGWYHSHPGFGVIFSEMDAFIHKNFFSGDKLVAFVIDPLLSEESYCINADESGVKYIERIWVDGREKSGTIPIPDKTNANETVQQIKGNDDVSKQVRVLAQSIDGLKSWMHWTYIGLASIVVFLIINWLINIYFKPPYQHPKDLIQVPAVLNIEGKEMALFLGVKGWNIPEDLKSEMQTTIEYQQDMINALEKRNQFVFEQYKNLENHYLKISKTLPEPIQIQEPENEKSYSYLDWTLMGLVGILVIWFLTRLPKIFKKIKTVIK